jgi:hypothetical protein
LPDLAVLNSNSVVDFDRLGSLQQVLSMRLSTIAMTW